MSHPDLVGSYHTVRVVKVLLMHGFYLIQYDYVKAANGRTLEETLTVLMLRHHQHKRCFWKFKVGEHVDFFKDDAWWYGVVVAKPERKMYLVSSAQSFKFKDVVVHILELRRHSHWDGREYSRSPASVVPIV